MPISNRMPAVTAAILLLGASGFACAPRPSAVRESGVTSDQSPRPSTGGPVEESPARTCKPGPDGKIVLVAECFSSDVSIVPGLTLDTLGTVAVATFDVSGLFTCSGGDRKESVKSLDNGGVTVEVQRRLIESGISLVNRDMTDTDRILKELDLSTSDLIDQSSAPLIGHQLGVRTLIVGRYEFAGDFECSSSTAGESVIGKARKVSYQRVIIKAFNVEDGRVLISSEFKLGEGVLEKLSPRSIAKFGIQTILKRIGLDSRTP